MMHTKIMVLVAGAALSGCCTSGTGCYAPTDGAPIAWDGLGEAQTANGEPGSKNRSERRTARDREIIVGSLSETPARTEEGREVDVKLARQIRICRDCGL